MTTRRVSSGLRVSRGRVRARPFRRRRATPGPGPGPEPIGRTFAATFQGSSATLFLGGIAPGTVIDWGDGQTDEYPEGTSDLAAAVTHAYPSDGTWRMTLTGGFGSIGSLEQADLMGSLVSVDSWGADVGTTSALNAFYGATNLVNVAEPPPTVTSMSGMFEFASSFNADISGWRTGNVTIMSLMFAFATVFDQDLSGWDVGNVTDHENFELGSALTPEHLPRWVDA